MENFSKDSQNKENNLHELLIKAMHGKTQKQFAQEIGISKEHLCRLLYIENSRKPTRNTLLKIFKAGQPYVTLEELYESCGYDFSDIGFICNHSNSTNLGFDNFISILDSLLKDITRKVVIETNNISDILNNIYYKLIGFKNISYIVEKNIDNYVGSKIGEQAIVLRYIICDNLTQTKYSFFVILYYITTKNNSIILTDYAFDINSLLETNFLIILLKEYIEINNLKGSPYLQITEHYNQEDTIKNEVNTYYNIFGVHIDEKAHIFLDMKKGPGFYLDNVPNNFIEFLRNHRKSFDSNEYEEEALNAILSGVPIEEACAYLKDATLLSITYTLPIDNLSSYSDTDKQKILKYAYGIIIAEILNRELNKKYIFCCLNNDIEGNKPCIMLNTDKNIIDYQELHKELELLKPYAKELGIEYVENCYYYVKETQIHFRLDTNA